VGDGPNDLAEVRTRLAARDLAPRTVALALAAVRGEDTLGTALASDADPVETSAAAADGASSDDQPTPAEADAPPEARALLTSIEVTGFRGIGPTASLELTPAAGLTLVVGRNGSGKSSFAEAVEFALTGSNARWATRSKVWRDGWRNLHHPGTARVAATLHVDGPVGTVVAARSWTADAKLEEASASLETADGPVSAATLRWDVGLALYRPFLPYSELGAMIDEGPSALHDALAAVLGLDQLADAAKRCKVARLVRERAWKQAAADGGALARDLRTLDDERAERAATELEAKSPSFEVLEELAVGSDAPDRSLDLLRQLAGLRGPDLDAVRRAAGALDEALAAAADHVGTDAARDLEVADLLAAARQHHGAHGDVDCPVCGSGALDATWAADAARREDELRAAAAAVRQADASVRSAERAVRELTGPAPGVLERGGAVGVDVTSALDVYARWAAIPHELEPKQRATALRTVADELVAALADVREQAAALVREREDAWRPAALRLARWLDTARPARAGTAAVADLKAAERALGDVLDELRAERWRPIADAARQTWEALRHRSNVSVDEVALAGSGVRRRVEVKVTVDGVEGAALGVMSQGELHALALSLFLPRATLPESPFGFVVLDDPVQSMDPARVDGLARVLDAAAASHQVVVFTHDDRLPEAVRRLGIAARVLEVTRGARSSVTVRETKAPWRRHLDDARALARTDDVPDLVRRTTVPTFARLALEAAAADAFRRRAIEDGTARSSVDVQLAEATTLLQQLALGLFGTARRAGDVYGQLNRLGGWAADAVRACNEGSHGGFDGDALALVKDVEDVVRKALL
jgi:recombinational DNA repair ATPase RecF